MIPKHAFAQILRATPGITASTRYDDNIFFDDVSDFEGKITPSITLERLSERFTASWTSRGDYFHYFKYDEYDRFNHDHLLQLTHRYSPRLNLSLTAGLTFDHTFESTLEDIGIVADKTPRRNFHTSLGGGFALDERNSLDISLAFFDTDFDSSRYVDNRSVDGNIAWIRALRDNRTKLVGMLGAQQINYYQESGKNIQRIARALAGVDRDLSENLSGYVRAGVHYARTESEPEPRDMNKDNHGLDLDAQLRWAGQRSNVTLNADHGLTQGVYGENITRLRLRGNIGYDLTEALAVSLFGRYIQSKYDEATRDDTESYGLGTALAYRFKQDMLLRCGYDYTLEKNRDNNASQHRNRVFVEFGVEFPHLFP